MHVGCVVGCVCGGGGRVIRGVSFVLAQVVHRSGLYV